MSNKEKDKNIVNKDSNYNLMTEAELPSLEKIFSLYALYHFYSKENHDNYR